MSYQSGDRLKNRYLSSDAFTSLKNKLGGRSITSLGGDRRQKSYRVANQGFDLLDYKPLIYKTFISLLLLIIVLYVIPQTRYMLHGYVALKSQGEVRNKNMAEINENSAYSVAPVFLKTDEFVAKRKDVAVSEGTYVEDYVTGDIIGTLSNASSSKMHIKLFSDAGFKNNFLIEQDIATAPRDVATTSSSTEPFMVKEANHTYQSYVFEGLGYGQLVAKVPPKTEVKKDTAIYIRTVDGLKPIGQIIDVDEDNKSTFTIIHAQLMISPQNIYKVIIK